MADSTASGELRAGEASRRPTKAREDGHPDTQQPVDATAKQGSLLTFFIPTLEGGGAERVVLNLVNGLARRGYEVEVLLSRYEGHWRAELAADVGVVTLPPESGSMFGVGAHLPALMRYLRMKSPTALFPHLTHVNVLSIVAVRLAATETAVVPTHHLAYQTKPRETRRDQLAHWAGSRLYGRADRVIAVSECVADGITAETTANRDEISVLYNPIDIDTVRRDGEEPLNHDWLADNELDVVLFVGRLEPQKDLRTWLRAFEQVHREHTDTRAVIAGRGRLRETLRSFAADLGLEDVVSFPGYVENAYRYMHRADCFLLASKVEGLPTVLIEALACGCPVVATDCACGPSEILAEGRYGSLAPVGAADQLAAAVVTTLGEPLPPEELQQRASVFGVDARLDAYERFLAQYIMPM
jgi:glycosyltransferase involved in cell wall biosynthesis